MAVMCSIRNGVFRRRDVVVITPRVSIRVWSLNKEIRAKPRSAMRDLGSKAVKEMLEQISALRISQGAIRTADDCRSVPCASVES